jgi:hypothetical protein
MGADAGSSGGSSESARCVRGAKNRIRPCKAPICRRNRVYAPHRLLGEGTVSLVASDAHGAGRLPVLDVARETIAQRLGADVADPLFDGCALQAGHD